MGGKGKGMACCTQGLPLLITIDETPKNEKTPSCMYGRSKRGHHVQMCQQFIHGICLTATALLIITISVMFEGSMMKQLYLEFLEKQVVSYIAVCLLLYGDICVT